MLFKDVSDTPVLFLIFNRLDTTKKVLAEIRNIKPKRIYIAADGPRQVKGISEKENVDAVRMHVMENIDWDCECKTLFRDNNLGCRQAISSAITWFFENEEAGIILEDDCVPSASFFMFCHELLNYYSDDTRVMHIGGNNFDDGQLFNACSYYFSHRAHVWGWATWKRAWVQYEHSIPCIESELETSEYIPFSTNKAYDAKFFALVRRTLVGEIDTWDYLWSMAIACNNGLAIVPKCNLVKNIGFSNNATNTKSMAFFQKFIKESETLGFPLVHPCLMKVEESAERYHYKKYFNVKIYRKVYDKITYAIGNARN